MFKWFKWTKTIASSWLGGDNGFQWKEAGGE